MNPLRVIGRGAALPIYPFLVAAYPVVFLYAQNVQEAIAPSEILIPLAVSLGATALVMLGVAALTHDWAASALTSALLLVLFFTYGLAWESLGAMLLGQWVLLAAWLLLAVTAVSSVWRLREHATRLTVPLNAAVGLALVVNLVSIGIFEFNLRPTTFGVSGVTASGAASQPVARPDVYWIILEEYASESVIASDFHFDNSAFVEALRERGFYIADQSTANYLKTAPSVQSTRNLEYLDGAALRAEASSAGDWGPLYRLLNSPFELQTFLDGLGYRFLYGGSYWPPMQTNSAAEVNYVYEGASSEFLTTLERATLLRALADLGPAAPFDWRRDRLEQTLYELRSLEHASTLAGPKFVHFQLSLDHEPYVFHPDGSFVTDAEEQSLTHEQQYVGQLKYTNAQILAWLDKVMEVPASQRPIVVLMADEGPWPFGYRVDERHFDWTSASAADLQEKFGIMNAVYLPDQDPEQAGFYPSITPVNEFRVLLNAEFGLSLPLLPDRNYIWPNQTDIYTYIDATDKVPR
jgi:hypothetical protein